MEKLFCTKCGKEMVKKTEYLFNNYTGKQYVSKEIYTCPDYRPITEVFSLGVVHNKATKTFHESGDLVRFSLFEGMFD